MVVKCIIKPFQTENGWVSTLSRRALLVIILVQICQMTSWRRIGTSWHCVITSGCDITWRHMTMQSELHRWTHLKITFSTKCPWPLTYDLCLMNWPRNCQGQPLHQILCPYVKRLSQQSADKRTHWHTHTDGPILYCQPLTREDFHGFPTINNSMGISVQQCVCLVFFVNRTFFSLAQIYSTQKVAGKFSRH